MDEYKDFIARVRVNTKEAKDKLEELQKLKKRLEAEKKTAMFDGDVKAADKLRLKILEVEKAMKQYRGKAEDIEKTLDNISTSSFTNLQKAARLLNNELKNTERGTEAYDMLKNKLKEVNTAMKEVKDETKAHESLWQRFTNFLNNNWGATTQLLGSITGLGAVIRNSTNAYAEMEEAMAGVRKYTGQTDRQVREMNEDLKMLDTRTAREQLNELAGAAGRLGITAKSELLDFVEVGNMINVSLGDDLGKGAIDNIGKLAMAFGEDDKMGLRGAMMATGSTVNELAQNSSANAGYLVDFTARLAGIGKQAGMTQAQIMGLGSVLDENMQRDEMASTVMSNLIAKLATDTKDIAQIAGLEVEKFTSLVKNDMNAALLLLFSTMNEKGGLLELAPMFSQMGLDGSRAVSVLNVLAGKIQDVEKNQRIANEAYREATSIADEYNVQNNTVQAGIDKAKKRFQEIAIELGERLMPITQYVITTTGAGIKILSVLTKFIMDHSYAVASAAIVYGVYNVAVKLANAQSKVRIALATAGTALLKAKTAVITALALAQGKLNGHNALAITLQRKLNALMLKFPGTWMAAGASAVALALVKMQMAVLDTDRAAERMRKEIEKETKAYQDNKKAINELVKTARDETESKKNREDAINALKKIMPGYLDNLDMEKAKLLDVNDLQEKLNENHAKSLLLKARETELEYNKAQAAYNANNNGIGMTTGSTSAAVIAAGERANLEALRKAAEVAREAWEEFNESMMPEMKLTDPNAVGGSVAKRGNGGKTDKQLGKEENERLTRAKKLDEQEKASVELKMAAITAAYRMGEMDYREYQEDLNECIEEGLKKRMSFYRQSDKEYKELLKESADLHYKAEQEKSALSEEEIERRRLKQEMLLRSMFTDKNSEIYQDEYALSEALHANDIEAMQKKYELYKKTYGKLSKEAENMAYEIEKKESSHRLDNIAKNEKVYLELKKRYSVEGVDKEEKIALDGLERLRKEKEIDEKTYQEWRLAITKEYADKRQEAEREKWAKKAVENGPGSNEAKFNSNVDAGLEKAKALAGDGYDPNGEKGTKNPFAGAVRNYRNVAEQLKILYKNDELTFAEYQAAKAQIQAETMEKIVNTAKNAYDGISQMMSAMTSYYSAQAEYETSVVEKKYEKQIDAAGSNTAKGKKLEEKKQKEIAAIKTRYNKKQTKIQIAQAVAQTAMAAINAYSSAAAIPVVGHVMAPIAAAIAVAAGMIQVAAIKKQAQVQESGYYKGGFTSRSSDNRKEVGVVHANEFVANHEAVANRNILPALQLIDSAQRNNTVARLTASDVTRAMGAGSYVVQNVNNISNDSSDVRIAAEKLNNATAELVALLGGGIEAYAVMDGERGWYKTMKHYERLINNKK